MARRLEILGEAAAQLPAEVKARFASIPWRQIVATRNHLIHGYFGVNLQLVWQTTLDDLPPLQLQLQQAAQRLHAEDGSDSSQR